MDLTSTTHPQPTPAPLGNATICGQCNGLIINGQHTCKPSRSTTRRWFTTARDAVRTTAPATANDACGICGYWKCRCTTSGTRRLLTTARNAIRSVVTPAALVTAQAEQAPAEPVTAPDPDGLYTADDMPDVEIIEAAARTYDRAVVEARRADRGKRAAKKLLDRLPAGLYGTWAISRKESSRKVVDLEAVAATYKRLGLGPVPMKVCAASLVVAYAEANANPGDSDPDMNEALRRVRGNLTETTATEILAEVA